MFLELVATFVKKKYYKLPELRFYNKSDSSAELERTRKLQIIITFWISSY